MIVIGGQYLDSNDLRNLGVAICGDNVKIHSTCEIVGAENLEIGSNVRIDPYTILVAGRGSIKIGNYVHIAAYSYISGGGHVELHDFAGLSQGVRIYSMTDDYTGGGMTNPTVPPEYLNLTAGRVIVGKHCIIGSGSVVLPSAHLHDGCSVGALSLVKGTKTPWSIYAGCPAKKIGERRSDIILCGERAIYDDRDNFGLGSRKEGEADN